jgi:hypothetical protein
VSEEPVSVISNNRKKRWAAASLLAIPAELSALSREMIRLDEE